MTCIGKVSQGKVLLPPDVHLPDGISVRVDTIVVDSTPLSGAKFRGVAFVRPARAEAIFFFPDSRLE